MLKKIRVALLLGFVAALALSGKTASAQDPYGLGYAYLFGYGGANTPAIRSFVPAPPYFALHPPVYYGQRYARPYGDSPFASWPQLRSPANYMPRPAAEHAPFVTPYTMPAQPTRHASPVVKSLTPVQPLVIENPYYPGNDASRLVTR